MKVLKVLIYYLTPITLAANKKSENSKYWQESGEIVIFVHCRWKYKMMQSL